jgi:hypothetical protein
MSFSPIKIPPALPPVVLQEWKKSVSSIDSTLHAASRLNFRSPANGAAIIANASSVIGALAGYPMTWSSVRPAEVNSRATNPFLPHLRYELAQLQAQETPLLPAIFQPHR